jgi:Na+/serine symporter
MATTNSEKSSKSNQFRNAVVLYLAGVFTLSLVAYSAKALLGFL